MNCEKIRQHWHLYYDSEGDPELHFEIREHLDACPACAQWFAGQEWLERRITEKLRAGSTDRKMWNRLLVASGLVSRGAVRRRWRWLTGAATASIVGALVLVAGRLLLDPTQPSTSLAALAESLHRDIESGRQPLGMVSDSDVQVESYFKRHAAFSVRCPPRKDAGFQVRGGGMCALRNQPAAFVVGEVDNGRVSLIVLPDASLEAFPEDRRTLAAADAVHHFASSDYTVAARHVDRNLVFAVGRVKSEKILRVLSAYGSYPETRRDAKKTGAGSG